MELSKNGKVEIEKYNNYHKIICKQTKSTPGSYKVFNVKPNTVYYIKINYGNFNGKPIIWVATFKNKNIEFHNRICFNRKHGNVDLYIVTPNDEKINKIKVGVLFVEPKIDHFYEIKNIIVKESNKSSKKKLAIIVPYRDRMEHMKTFIPYMNKYLNNFNSQIFIIHQKNDDLFNRAALFNIGFHIVKNKFDYFAFHDIDLLPEGSDYSYPDNPTHLSQRCSQFGYKKKKLFGGVVLLTKEQFIKSNGFSNLFKGWGGEDDDMRTRVKVNYLIDYRPGKYKSLEHPHTGHCKNPHYNKNKKRYQLTKLNPDLANKDGINCMQKSFKYEILNLHLIDSKFNLNLNKKIAYKNKRNYMIDVNF